MKRLRSLENLLKEEGFSENIIYWDERLTSMQTNRIMIDADVSRKKRKENVDMMAAIFILQSYLDFINNQKKGELEMENRNNIVELIDDEGR